MKTGYVVAFERTPYGNDNFAKDVVIPWCLYSDVFYKKSDAEMILKAEQLKGSTLKHILIEVSIPE